METPNPGTRPSQPHPHQPPGQHEPQEVPAPPGADSARWAPWWVYLIVLVGANQVRARLLLPAGTVPEAVVVVIALVQAAVLFAAVTAVWRHVHRSGR